MDKKFERVIAEWISDKDTIIAKHEFPRLGAALVVVETDGAFSVYRFFGLGDRIECSIDVNEKSAAEAFQRLMEVTSF